MGKRIVLMAVLIVGACGGGGGDKGPGPTCRSATEACAVTGDCCSSLICTNNVCTAAPTCRAATQACAVTADCCSSLICTNNVCTAAPTCRAASTACATTADCCSPLVCLTNRCQTAPPADVCGDGICSGNETTTSCCRDCGCPSGSTCNGTTCVNVGLSNMTWSMQHVCANGEQIELRFFDVTNLGIWPSDLTQVYVLPSGVTQQVTLACTTGAQICFGGREVAHGLYWGVDTDFSQDCTDCCQICSTTTINQALTCN